MVAFDLFCRPPPDTSLSVAPSAELARNQLPHMARQVRHAVHRLHRADCRMQRDGGPHRNVRPEPRLGYCAGVDHLCGVVVDQRLRLLQVEAALDSAPASEWYQGNPDPQGGGTARQERAEARGERACHPARVLLLWSYPRCR